MKEKLFDTHAHYYDKRFAAEHDGGADDLLKSLFGGDVGYIINVATNIENASECISLAKKYKTMYTALGIHPTDCMAYNDPGKEIDRLCRFVGSDDARKENKVVAIGEIGLDYHYENTDREKQKAFFEAQMALAEEIGLPVVIHDREAHGDVMEMIRRFPGVRGVLHSYSGSAETVKELLKRGWYISFSGVVTFTNAPKVREAAAAVVPDRLLIETDCPYLAPHPHRGELNHSGYMTLTAQALADIHGVDIETIVKITSDNAKRLFEIN